MIKFIILAIAITIAIGSPAPVGEVKQFNFGNFGNNLIPSLFPQLFPNRQTVDNPILIQIKPFIDPLSTIVQPLLNPALKPINNNFNKVPIVGNIVSDCTGNALNCLLNNVDNMINKN